MRESPKARTNADFADHPPAVFLRACRLAGIPPTRRQASKWRSHKGIARQFCNQAIAQLVQESRAEVTHV